MTRGRPIAVLAFAFTAAASTASTPQSHDAAPPAEPRPDAFPASPTLCSRPVGRRMATAGLAWDLNRTAACLVNSAETHVSDRTPSGNRPAERGLLTRLQGAF